MIYDILVVGAGPSGMMAAIEAKNNRPDLKIGIIDKNSSMGRKLLITGGGRCNITNNQDIDDFFKYVVRNPKFLYSAFSSFSNRDLIDFFEINGLKVKCEGNKIYPIGDDAKGVLGVLENKLRELAVEFIPNSTVAALKITESSAGELILINTEEGETLSAKRIIIATGGASYKATGSDGEMFKLLEGMGIEIKTIMPTLVKLNSNQEFIIKSQGISLNNTKFTITSKNKKIAEVEGSLVFTHNGISGPSAINSSSYITDKSLSDIKVFIDFIPEITESAIKEAIREKDKKNLDTKLSKFLPKEFIKNVLSFELKMEPSITENQIQNMKKEEIQKIVNAFKCAELKLTGYGGLNESIVTRGGIAIKEINPKMLNLKKFPNIYVSGEMIDVDAFTGGFNLQIAFSTGYLAGKNASDSF
ncbi:MAG: NAD(P)/FAD-dependent oxidoreductase [Proteocatella sp.]